MPSAEATEVDGAQSQNFQFLVPTYPFLEAIAAWAEQYAHHDPAASLNKTRQLGEGLLREANRARYGLPWLEGAHFSDLIFEVATRASLPIEVRQRVLRGTVIKIDGAILELPESLMTGAGFYKKKRVQFKAF